MSPIEELKGMSHEDLVRRVQELKEANENLKKEKDDWVRFYTEAKTDYDNIANIIKSALSLMKR